MDGKRLYCGRPFDRSPPMAAGVLDREIQQLQRRFVGREVAAGLHDLAQAPVCSASTALVV